MKSFQSEMIGVHAARLAALELEEDLEAASILLSATVIVMVICMTSKSAILNIVISMCKSMPSTRLKYSVRLIDSNPIVFKPRMI